uniref:Phorbol-ester/DAG-type domain-containing protein n=1 Tax=Ascaris lumbricoides TaxID=6252 RepID=A0A9J2P3B4_ASCLU
MSLTGEPLEGSSSFTVGQSHSPLLSRSSPIPGGDTYGTRSRGSSPPCTSPKRLNSSLILLHLPFNQHSKLEVKPGVLVRDAIAKILEKRAILPQMCNVCIGADPSSPRIDLGMDLETLNSLLEEKELWVHSAYLSILVSIQHSFVRKTFLTVAFCDVCRKQIWLQGYRCELCQFKFHQKCGSKVPNYCDRMQQIPHDVHMANKLRDFCEQHGGPNAALVAEIIQHFQSPNAEANSSRHSGGISRQQAVRLPARNDVPVAINESSRDRSSSAPNIYEITKDESLLEAKVFPTARQVRRTAQRRGLGIASPSGASRDWHTCAFRRSTNRLQPFGGGSSTFASSPTSTSSSPPPASCSSSGAAADRPSALSPTPPQSAPPQKSIGFPRFRSKSPSDKAILRGAAAPSSKSSDRLGDSHDADNKEKVKQRMSMEDWEIDSSLVTYNKKIGSGSFGTVLRYLERASADLPRLKRSVSEPQLHRTRFEPNDFTMQLQSPNTPQLPAAANFPLFSAYNLSEHL